LEPLTERDRTAEPHVPKDLHDLLECLEGYHGDDEGRFDATYLWPWRNLTSRRRNWNERILRTVLKRLLAPKASLERHWRRLHADVQEYRRRQKKSGKLIKANAAQIVINAVVDALLPVKEVSSKELASMLRSTSRTAEELIACLMRLRNIGMNLDRLLSRDESTQRDNDENEANENGESYEDARFYIYMKMPRSLTHEERADLTTYALRVVMRDPSVAVGILARVAQADRVYKVKRHNLSGRQRLAYVMAEQMVRDSIRFFGSPRYERAEAFAKAASGVQIKGLRQMIEREKRTPATKGPKVSRNPLRGN